MKYLFAWICSIAFVFAGCDNELESSALTNGVGGVDNDLSISVQTENIESKGLVTGSYLDANVSIGVSMRVGYVHSTPKNNNHPVQLVRDL